MKRNLKKISILFEIFVFALLINSFTSCLLDINGPETSNNSENDTDNTVDTGSDKNHQKDKDDVFYLSEYPPYSEMRNVSLYINFDGYLSEREEGKGYSYTHDNVFAERYKNDTRAPGVLRDLHGKVCELKSGISESYFQIKTTVNKPSVLNFQMRADVCDDNTLILGIDNKKYRVMHNGTGDAWKKVSVSLAPGYHTIRWSIPRQIKYSPQLLNVIYIDNITVVEDKLEFIDIYPKGLQETYVGGMPIKFKAVPLRGDRSVINNKYVTYSVSGCGTIDSNGVFRPTDKGTCTVTATIDGKSVYKTDIKVYGKNYLEEPVTVGRYNFTGDVSIITPSGVNLDTQNTKYEYPQTPVGVNFKADGFFVLKGNTKTPIWIQVLKDGTSYKTNYFIRKPGDFYKRIWLRLGPGKYIINIIEDPDMKFFDTMDSRYEGDLISTSGKIVKRLTVENTNSMPTEEALWLLPSEVVQSDSFYVSNAAHSILAGLPSNATDGDKLRAIHDWELYNHYYDMVSVNHQERRKRQDAEAVLKYGLGVCEGYANLYAALVRNADIKCKVICEETKLMHAWNHAYYNGNWYLVDVTWDDPVTDGSDLYNDKAPGRENYTYFMTAHTDSDGRDGGHIVPGVGDPGRSALGEDTISTDDIGYDAGMPEGCY